MKLLTVAAMAFTLLAGSVNAAEQLNAYSIMPEKYASKVFAEFTKDTGVKVNFMRFSSGEALARLNAEKKNPQVDVMLGGPADTYAAGVKEGIFEQYRPKDSDAIPASLRDPQNHWTGIGIIPLCFLTNTKFLEKNKMHAPESWNDLLDPKWKGQIVMTDPGTAGTTKYAVGALMASKDYGPEYFRKLKENGTELQSGTTATHNQIAAGAYKVGMCLDYVTENLKTKGSTIEFVYPEKDGISIYSPIALVKGAANMDNGKLLYDFILSKEGQDVLVANNLLSVRKDIKQRDVTIEEIAAHAMNIDLATLAANANKVLDDFDAIFKKK